jgi:hypothetical protein
MAALSSDKNGIETKGYALGEDSTTRLPGFQTRHHQPLLQISLFSRNLYFGLGEA